MRTLVSLLASAAVFLAGCTLIPEYTQPEPPIQAQWPTGTAYYPLVSLMFNRSSSLQTENLVL
jgi:hypothetical protein